LNSEVPLPGISSIKSTNGQKMRARICAKPSGHELDSFGSKTYQSATRLLFTKSISWKALLYMALLCTRARIFESSFIKPKRIFRSQGGISQCEWRRFISLVLPSATHGMVALEPEHDTNRIAPNESELATADDILVEFDGVTSPHIAQPSRRNWLTSSWEVVAALWAHWRRAREIRKTVSALAELDDRTSRNIGIPHRSQIEQAERDQCDHVLVNLTMWSFGIRLVRDIVGCFFSYGETEHVRTTQLAEYSAPRPPDLQIPKAKVDTARPHRC
jgi:hypothetical protein